jgi:adenosylcobyric acid synthase
MQLIAERTGWPALGLVPYLDTVRALPAEDSMELADRAPARRLGARVHIAVPLLPCIANFDDLDPLQAEPDVDMQLVATGRPLPLDCDLIILPGSKATIADLAVLRMEGWDVDLAAYVRAGGHVLGLCGGYQMLGRHIADRDGIEGPPGEVDGLGLLDVDTVLSGDKRLAPASGVLTAGGARLHGYEMHIGRTSGPATSRPLIRFDDGRNDGAMSPDGHVCGTYVHGLFAADECREAWLAIFEASVAARPYGERVDNALNELAEHIETHVDVERLLKLAR